MSSMNPVLIAVFLFFSNNSIFAGQRDVDSTAADQPKSHLEKCKKVLCNAKTKLNRTVYPPHAEYLITHSASRSLRRYIENDKKAYKHYAKVFTWIHKKHPNLTVRTEPTLLQSLLELYWEVIIEDPTEETAQKTGVIGSFIEKLLEWIPLETWSKDLRSYLEKEDNPLSKSEINIKIKSLHDAVDLFVVHQHQENATRVEEVNRHKKANHQKKIRILSHL